MSVLFINHALYDFASKHSSASCNPFTWPVIQFMRDRTFHPILNAHHILMKKSSDKSLVQQLSQLCMYLRMGFHNFAVNSCGDIILVADTKILIIYRTGESKDIGFLNATGRNVITDMVFPEEKSFAVDSNDNLYVVKLSKTRNNNGVVNFDLLLYVFDENYDIKLVSVLDFLDGGRGFVEIAVDKNQRLIMCRENQVYVADNRGELISQFERDGLCTRSLDICNNNDIMIPSDDGSAVEVYSTEGNLKSTVKVPDGHEVKEVAFHHGIGKIIVLTYVSKQDTCFLLSYSETGKLEKSIFLSKRSLKRSRLDASIKCHSSGQFAVAVAKTITFI